MKMAYISIEYNINMDNSMEGYEYLVLMMRIHDTFPNKGASIHTCEFSKKRSL